MLRIKALKLTDIRTFQSQSVKFSDGINIVYGENGAGKTTLLQAVLGSLLGFRHVTRTGTQIQDLIRDGKTQGKVQLHFTIGDKEYRVITTLKSKKQEIKLQRRNSQNLWEDLAGPKVTEFEREMENLLGISIDVLNRVIYCPQNELTNIISTKAEDRKKVFERLLGINKYRIAETLANELIRHGTYEVEKLEQRIDRDKELLEELPKIQQELESCLKEAQSIGEKINQLEAEAKTIEIAYTKMVKKKEQHNQLIGKISEIEKSMDILKQELMEKQQNLEKKQELLALSIADLERIEEIMQETEMKIQELETSASEKNTQQGVLSEKISTMQETKEKLLEAQEEIRKLRSEIERIAPFMKELSETEIKKLEKEKLAEALKLREVLDDLKSQISRNEARKELLLASINELSKKIQLLEGDVEEIKQQLGERTEWNLELFDDESLRLETLIIQNQEKLSDVNSEIAIAKEKVREILKKRQEDLERIRLLKTEEEPICPVCKKQLTIEERDRLLEKYQYEVREGEQEEKNLQNKIEQLHRIEGTTQKTISELKKQKEELDLDKKSREKLEELIRELTRLRSEQQNLIRELNHLSLETLRQQQETYEKALTKCEASLEVLKEVDEKRKEMERYVEQALSLKSKLEDFEKPLEEQLQQVEKELDFIRREKKRYKEREKELAAVKRALTEIDVLKQRILAKEKEYLEQLEELQKLDFNNKKFEEIEDAQKITRDRLKEAQKDLEFLTKNKVPELKIQERKLKDLSEELKQIQAKKNEYERLLRVLETSKLVFKQFPEYIAEIRLNNAQKRANQIIRRFFEDRDIDGLQITHKKYEIKAIRSGKPESVERLSGGEQAVLALSLRIALMEEMGQLGLMLLDEPTAALDQTRIEEFVSFLEESRIFQQLILVTHREEFLQSADNPIQIRRRFDSSTISTWESIEET